MLKFINAITIYYTKGWHSDKHYCLFLTKLYLSFLFWMNIASSLILLLGKTKGLDIAFYKINGFPVSFPAFLIIMYTALTIFFPKKKIFVITLEKNESKRYLRTYAVYAILSIALMILAAVFSK